MTEHPRTAVLLLAYGTPEYPDQVEAYYTHIRGGRAPSPDAVANLKSRYEAVGGRTPLTKITRDVAVGVQRHLAAGGVRVPVYIGMKHWEPWIADTVAEMLRDDIERVIGIVLAPHYSRYSVGSYQRYLFDAMQRHGAQFEVSFVEQWYAREEFLDVMQALIDEQLQSVTPEERAATVVLFSAHSLPERIRDWGDPYERQLLESAKLVADRCGLADFRLVWQSAGATGEPWIGPDVLEYLDTLAHESVRHVLQVPIGFVSDHLEILYDLDIEARQKAHQLGIHYRRTPLPNTRGDFLHALARIAKDAILGVGAIRVNEAPPAPPGPASTSPVVEHVAT